LVGGKRLEKYTPDDVQLLRAYVSRFHRLLSTSTILTETSNLIGQVLKGRHKEACLTALFGYFNHAQPSQFQRRSQDAINFTHMQEAYGLL
jgi:hypothetical protein